MTVQQVLIDGQSRDASHSKTFQATNPSTREALPDVYPVSDWSDCEEAIVAASKAFAEMRDKSGEQIAAYLEKYAELIESRADDLVAMAHSETGLPVNPRLAAGELPRTTGQLRQAAAAAREGSWKNATIDTQAGIRSCLEPIGPVVVLGPNNFPFAFNSVAGGDFAAALAAGNPVIGKANSSHPGTTRIFAELALEAAKATGMPDAIAQLVYRTSHEDGERLVSDRRIGAVGFTGSRHAGLKLKAAADAVGKPIYLELSSINPVVILPGAMKERADEIVDEFTGSCLMGSGQFCTNPGLVAAVAGDETESFVAAVTAEFNEATPGTLLSEGVETSLRSGIETLKKAGASETTSGETTSGEADSGARFCNANTLLRVEADKFLADPETFQTEAFGNASLVVVANDVEQLVEVISELEGNLTGCIYSDSKGADEDAYSKIVPALSLRVGRLLNDKMPTGVAVSPAMNHGGPFPATGHPTFTSVGIPASIVRFSKLTSYDNVRHDRLPATLQNANPGNGTWRLIDGQWTQEDVS